MARLRAAFALASLLALPFACGGSGAPPAAVPERVENAGLGVVFTELPAGVRVVRNDGATLELAAADEAGEGTLRVIASEPRVESINLVEEAKAFGAEATAGGGEFFGGNELVTPYGSAYTVRATVDGGAVEERRVLMVHPGDSDRLLTLALSYPPGDKEGARRRLQQMLELVTVLEPLDAAPAVD